MVPQLEIKDEAGWFINSGNLGDVVISSRVRISRNLAGYYFPWKMKEEDKIAVSKQIKQALDKVKQVKDFGISKIEDLSEIEKNLLLERNYINKKTIDNKKSKFFLSSDNLTTGIINDIDHLKLVAFESGFNIRSCYGRLDKIDRELEKYLEYAVSFEYGYLCSEIISTGTGMKTSVIIHVPALKYKNLIDKVFKMIMPIGFTTENFYGIDIDSQNAGIYQISNKFGMGYTEVDMIKKLEKFVSQIVDFEKQAREELLSKKKIEIEDMIYRAWGVLNFCKIITAKEAIKNLLIVRYGISIGIVNFPLELCTSLIYLCKKSYIQKQLHKYEEKNDENIINYRRAEIIKYALDTKNL